MRYDLSQHWEDPARTRDVPYEKWCQLVDSLVREKELEERQQRLLQRVSTERYARLLYPTDLKPAVYLSCLTQRGRLGQWLLLHLRAGALPLLVRAARWASPEWSQAARVCMLCGNEQEDELHFVARCAAYRGERLCFGRELRARFLEAGHDLSQVAVRQALSAAASEDESLYALVLGNVQAVRDLHLTLEQRMQKRQQKIRPDSRERHTDGGEHDGNESQVILDAVCSIVWSTSSNYLSSIWKYRCTVLGGVLLPDKQGAMCVEPVTSAFRCRTL